MFRVSFLTGEGYSRQTESLGGGREGSLATGEESLELLKV